MVDSPFGPPVPSVPLLRSPLSFVVARIQIPLVASISQEYFVADFQEQIRSAYPDLRKDLEQQFVIGPDGVQAQKQGVVWRFTDDRSDWQVALGPEFLALASHGYTNRADFVGRFGDLAHALHRWIMPSKVRRLGVRYVDRVGPEHFERLHQMVRAEVLGPLTVDDPEHIELQHSLTDCQYAFDDGTALRARWGRVPAQATFDPVMEPLETPSWVLDLDASHDERPFDPNKLREQVQDFSDRIYRYFRWAMTDDFLTTFEAAT
ncbi:MAG: TIGR04255 family protein [Acidimicrobiaceae bacterium]|nr:TIGR04255 family protein [Acidimicrobiaceae bacterium]MCY3607339.1 TIGR04255 family protein [Acidimicrobiaceae bacterium]MDE0676710.1 TIGR04255 family protein [Acidimicrobiaceae bacterium]